MEGPKKLNTQTCTQQMYNTNVLQNCTNKYTNLMYKRNVQKNVHMKCTLHLFIFCVIFLGLPYMYKTKLSKKPIKEMYT